jgi:hypothetical protein
MQYYLGFRSPWLTRDAHNPERNSGQESATRLSCIPVGTAAVLLAKPQKQTQDFSLTAAFFDASALSSLVENILRHFVNFNEDYAGRAVHTVRARGIVTGLKRD